MRESEIKYILLNFLFLSCVFTQAQQPYALSLRNISELPDESIYSIHQDKKGLIWMATDEGLLQYDGFRYTSYKSEKQTSISGSNIKEDKFGRIWYQNFDGYLYYVSEGKLKHLRQNPPPGFISYGITDRYLFVVQKKGVDIFDLKSLKLIKTIFISIEKIESSAVLGQDIYLISDDIIYKIDECFNLVSNHFFVGKNLHIKYIFPYKNKLYVISKLNETKRLYFFDNQLNFIKSFPISKISQIQGSDVIDENIWLHTPQGTLIIDENGRDKTEKVLFPENSSSKVIKDYQDNYWFSSVNNGIYIVPDLEDKMYSLAPFYPKTFMKTREGYLSGTENGELIISDSTFGNKKILYSNKNKLPIYYLYYDKTDQNIIFSDNGFSVINEKKSATKHFDMALKEAVRLDQKYYAIAVSGFFGLLLNPNANEKEPSAWDDLFYKNRDKKEPQIAQLKKGLRAKSVAFLPERKQLIFATNVGTYSVHPNAEKELRRYSLPLYSNSLVTFENAIYLLDTKGNISRLKAGQKLDDMNVKWKIPVGNIRKMKCTDDKLILLSTNSVYSFSNEKLEKFNLPVKNSSIKDFWLEESSIILLNNENILTFSQKTQKNPKNIRFQIDHFLVNAISRDSRKFQEFNYNENNISVQFSVLEFVNNHPEVYYRINGNRWVLINKESRTVEFPSLSAGNYLIEFKLQDMVSDQKIQFEILLPFWKKWWFYLAVCSLSAALIFLYFRRQSKIMQQQIELLDEKLLLEKSLRKSVLVSIKSQMNPHFFYNALNTIQAYIFTNDKKRASNYLSKFSKLTRIILEMSEKEIISLSEELVAIELYLDLERMRFSDNFTYKISIDDNIDKDEVTFPPMLLQPYIENAVKHGLLHQRGAKYLHISFEQKKDLLYISVDDNGVGRKRAMELSAIKNKNHKSFSTQANEKRLEMLNKERSQKITVEITDQYDSDGKAAGTLVQLVIPIK
ncbi:histidine kinase [Chryseobacterium sp. MYb264]|uniref:sensor histidine kinase n=1 Tax=Chryseobacterium sp. MYb264 TaxID=2745153 RepID=UPI002E14E60A|nr:histidine kinase [Chryseobacterium sp. MYb264]